MRPLAELADALEAHGANPADTAARRALAAASFRAGEAKYADGDLVMLAAARALVDAVMSTPPGSERAAALAEAGGPMARALIAVSAAPLTPPKTPPAPIRQYKDD